jgi:hypothetical protein
MYKILMIVPALLLSTTALFADDLAGCTGYMVAKDYDSALLPCLAAAEQGNPIAQINLGLMYRRGLGVEQDDNEALRWYTLAAEQGNSVAQLTLRYMYEEGIGTEPNYPDFKPATNRSEPQRPDDKFKAVLSCGFNGEHINILACFLDTELRLFNNGRTQVYKVYNIYELGYEDIEGLHIDLSNSFSLIAQNSHETLILGIIIYDATGREVYQDMVGRFGVLNVKN